MRQGCNLIHDNCRTQEVIIAKSYDFIYINRKVAEGANFGHKSPPGSKCLMFDVVEHLTGCRPRWDPPDPARPPPLCLSLTGCFLWVPHPSLSAPAPAPQPLPVGDSLPAVSMVTWLLIVCSELWHFFFFFSIFAGVPDGNECVVFLGVWFPALCVYCPASGNSLRLDCRIACFVEEYFHWFQLCLLTTTF